MFLELKILLIEHSLIQLYPLKQGIADTFLSDHDTFLIDGNKIVPLSRRARVSIGWWGIMRDEWLYLRKGVKWKLEVVLFWEVAVYELDLCLFWF